MAVSTIRWPTSDSETSPATAIAFPPNSLI